MPKKSKKRFTKARTVFRKAKRRGGGVKRGIMGRFNLGSAARGAAVLFVVDKAKSIFGFRLGAGPIDDDIDMIIAGLVDKKSSYFVPAGTAKLIKDVADGFLGTQTLSLGGLGFGGGNGGFAGD